jgi:hypothetical protein
VYLVETSGAHFLKEAIFGAFWPFSCGGSSTRVICLIILGELSGKYAFIYYERTLMVIFTCFMSKIMKFLA